MNDEQRASALTRPSPAELFAKVEMLPPVHPASEQEFTRLMQRSRQSGGERHRAEQDAKTPAWGRFKQSIFAFTGRMLGNGTIERDQHRQGGEGTLRNRIAAGISSRARGRLLLRLGTGLFSDAVAGELAHELSECLRHAELLGTAWQFEVLLSTPELSATRLSIICDDTSLRLRFACRDAEAKSLLENNRMMLLTRLGTISSRVVSLEIDECPVEGDDAGEAGRQA